MDSRKKKLITNSATGIVRQVITLVCGFILPKCILVYYGSGMYGLLNSITNYLGVIALLEMGIGPVIQSNLYRPLAKKDTNQISCIVVSAERFFRKIALIFVAYTIALIIFLPKKFDSFPELITISLIIIISISTFAQYFFGITYQLLLNSDQKAYVPQIIQIITLVLNTIVSVVLIKKGYSIQTVKLSTTLFFLMRPILQTIYVHRHYNINKKIQYEGEPIDQKWNGFSQHLAAVICATIDIVLLSLFSSVENVSVYSVYFLVVNGMTQIVMMSATGLDSLFGNMISNEEYDELNNSFDIIEWVIHASVTVVFSITSITIVEFVEVYTKNVNDANYTQPLFSVLLVLAYASQCLRVPYFRIIKAAGHYKQTQNGAYISAAINVIISLVLVIRFGLVGVAIGTIAAMFFHTIYFVYYISKTIIYRKISIFIKYIIGDLAIGIVAYISTSNLAMHEKTYYSWIIYLFKSTVIVILVFIVFSLILYQQQVKEIVNSIKNKNINKLKKYGDTK